MVTALHKDLDTAIKHAVGQLTSRGISVHETAPRDEAGYREGNHEQIYDVVVILSDPEERKEIPVEATKKEGIWAVEPLEDFE